MRDEDCVRLLQWCLPRLSLRWPGFRKVRRTVCKRIARRMRALGLDDPADYRTFLEDHADEWARLDRFCRIPISRFYRDKGLCDALGRSLLPGLAARAAARDGVLRCWSAGCASGEEAYGLRMIWEFRVRAGHPATRLEIVATDAEETMLRRAETACYGRGSLKELPAGWIERGFVERGGLFCVKPALRTGLAFLRQDIRETMPQGPFDLVLCRNLVFTYFAHALQVRLLDQMARRIAPGGLLVIGAHEALPESTADFVRAARSLPVYRLAERAA
jgi:chemotaxis protein methyltransferase CheR